MQHSPAVPSGHNSTGTVYLERGQEWITRTTRFCLLPLLLTSSAPLVFGAPQVKVQVGSSEATPGEELELPILISIGEETVLRWLRFNVCMPEALATFVEMYPGPVPLDAQGDLSSTPLADHPSCSGAAIQVSFSDTPVSGTLGNIRLKLSDEAPTDQEIEIQVRDLELERTGGGAEVGVEVGSILVIEAPIIFGCLFYMH